MKKTEARIERAEAQIGIRPKKFILLPELFELLRAGKEIKWERIHPEIRKLLNKND